MENNYIQTLASNLNKLSSVWNNNCNKINTFRTNIKEIKNGTINIDELVKQFDLYLTDQTNIIQEMLSQFIVIGNALQEIKNTK